jgi:alkylated DNA nucleotide flippase Atl1
MIIIGIDPHKASHTPVAIDEHEIVLSEMTTRSCRTQTQRLPCHRVVRSDGPLGQYLGGADVKASLIAMEAAVEAAT